MKLNLCFPLEKINTAFNFLASVTMILGTSGILTYKELLILHLEEIAGFILNMLEMGRKQSFDQF